MNDENMDIVKRDFSKETKHGVLWERHDQNVDSALLTRKQKSKIQNELFRTPEPLIPIEENLFYPEFNIELGNHSCRLMNLDFLADKESSKENASEFHSFHIEENVSIEHHTNEYPSFHDFESLNYGIGEKLCPHEDSFDL